MRGIVLGTLVAVAACSQSADSSPEKVEAAARAFLSLPAMMDAIVVRHVPVHDRRSALIHLVDETCADPLHANFVDWVNAFSLDSDEYPEFVQTLRAEKIDGPTIPVAIDGGLATLQYIVQTKEVFSLARNLGTVEELFATYRITNISADEVSKLLSAQKVPELVEFEMHVNKRVDLRLRRVGDKWKVSQVSFEQLSALLSVNVP